MIGLVRTAWLFTRGSQSVRIIRVTRPDGPVRLLINGPGPESRAHDADAFDCTRYQSELERRLVAQGYQLTRFTSGERRTGGDRRTTGRGLDRRRLLERVV
jgi:hypothetical protein